LSTKGAMVRFPTVKPTMRSLLALLMCLSTADAFASDIATARQLVEEAEFEKALKVIDQALPKAEHVRDRAALYELQGTVNLYLGKEAAARRSFEKLLDVVPDWSMAQTTSPTTGPARRRRSRPVLSMYESMSLSRLSFLRGSPMITAPSSPSMRGCDPQMKTPGRADIWSDPR